MNNIFNVLSICLPVFTALILGYFAKRKRLINKDGIGGLKAIVINFTLPAVLIGAFYKTTFDANVAIVAITMFVSCSLGLLAGKGINKLLKNKQEMLPFLTSGFEAGMLGYGLYIMLFGQSNLQFFAFADLGQAIFVFTLYMSLLNSKKEGKKPSVIKNMFSSPIFIAIVIGLVLGISGLGKLVNNSAAGETISAVLNYIAAPTGIIMLFVVGFEFEYSKKSLKSAFAIAGVRMAIMAVLCIFTLWILRMLIPVDYYIFWAVVLMFSLPAPFVLPLFLKDEKQIAVSATSLSVYTVITIVLFTVIAVISKGGYL